MPQFFIGQAVGPFDPLQEAPHADGAQLAALRIVLAHRTGHRQADDLRQQPGPLRAFLPRLFRQLKRPPLRVRGGVTRPLQCAMQA